MEDVHMEEAGAVARAEDGIAGAIGSSSESSSHLIAPAPSSHPHSPLQAIPVVTSGDPNAIPHELNKQSTRSPEEISEANKSNQGEDTRMDVDSSLIPEYVQHDSGSQDGQFQQQQQHHHESKDQAAAVAVAGGLDVVAEPRSEAVLPDGQPKLS